MLFHTNGIENRAVWNAMKLHAELIAEAGEKIIFVVDEKNIDLIPTASYNTEVLVYANKFDLMKKVFDHPDNKIFSPNIFSVISMSLSIILKKKQVYYWVQGSIPEESFMRHGSSLKKEVLSLVEKLAMKLASYHILVSVYMKEFYEGKYTFALNPIVVPCTSDLTFLDATKEKDSFAYVGGLSAWQKFDHILLMFNKINEKNKNAKLYIATGDLENAQKLCSEHLTKEALSQTSIQNIVTREEMNTFLNTKEYGFLIREDDVVNNVASPIKLAEYLSTGTNVIISRALTSYAQEVEDSQAGVAVYSIEEIDKINHFVPNPKKALSLYEKFFSRKVLVKEYQSIL